MLDIKEFKLENNDMVGGKIIVPHVRQTTAFNYKLLNKRFYRQREHTTVTVASPSFQSVVLLPVHL